AGGAAAPAQRADQAHEAAGLRRRIPLRPRRARRLRRRGRLLPRSPGATGLLPAGAARPGIEDSRKTQPPRGARPQQPAPPEKGLIPTIIAVTLGGIVG
nr:hypothetical protein [Tanacetum cinerariifolium]